MFEAIHGSAPRRAGQHLANPSGLLLSSVQMLVHIGQPDVATRVHNAWLRTIEDGIHTYDIYDPSVSKEKVGTSEFADAVIARLGATPTKLKVVDYPAHFKPITVKVTSQPPTKKELVGMDIFVDWRKSVEELAKILEVNAGMYLKLVMITNRGQKVYPGGVPETFCVDHWRCRFQAVQPDNPVTYTQIIELLGRLAGVGLGFIKTEGLFTFDGHKGFSLGQGQ
jgi:isocitrate dehydrogenase